LRVIDENVIHRKLGKEKQPKETMSKILTDHYRCPERFVSLRTSMGAGQDSGYFRFGTNTICYGQCALGVSRDLTMEGLPDALDGTAMENSYARIPFDPAQVVENLRLERYTISSQRGATGLGDWPFAQDLYYFLRPLMPTSLRRHFQQFHLKDWNKIPFPQWPVDTTIERFFEGLLALSMKAQRIDRIPFIWFWPEGAPSCAIVTHDVETVSGRDFCSNLMDIDDSFGIKSSFEIVPEARYEIPKTFLDGIRKRGFEINVQDLNHDGRLYRCRKEFLCRVEKINQYASEFGARGFRSAILYRNLNWYDQFRFSYDMSVPNVAHLDPQRGGCCTVFPYFIGDILELPLTTTQDFSLFRILESHSIELWKTQMKLIMEKSGLISFIVHPDYIDSEASRQTYRALLSHLIELRSQGKVWITQPGEVDQWWRERRQMSLVDRNGWWQIEGPGNERARLAYAILNRDSVRYQVDGPSPLQSANEGASGLE